MIALSFLHITCVRYDIKLNVSHMYTTAKMIFCCAFCWCSHQSSIHIPFWLIISFSAALIVQKYVHIMHLLIELISNKYINWIFTNSTSVVWMQCRRHCANAKCAQGSITNNSLIQQQRITNLNKNSIQLDGVFLLVITVRIFVFNKWSFAYFATFIDIFCLFCIQFSSLNLNAIFSISICSIIFYVHIQSARMKIYKYKYRWMWVNDSIDTERKIER